MASNYFTDILDKGIRSGQMPAKSREAREWFRKQTRENIKRVNERKFLGEQARHRDGVRIGGMYAFQYDAKHKATLKYWDRVPLVFPFKFERDGFVGINLHYLPPKLRARLMDGLYEHVTNTRYDDTTRIRLDYQLLNNVSNLRYFKPCVKRYLYSHVRSPFTYILPTEWDIRISLPLARFAKRTANRVYADSERSLYKVKKRQ